MTAARPKPLTLHSAIAGGLAWTFAAGLLHAAAAPIFLTTSAKEIAGIYRAEIDLATGAISEPARGASLTDANFLAVSRDGRTLYAAAGVGGVAAFAMEKSGALRLLNQRA